MGRWRVKPWRGEWGIYHPDFGDVPHDSEDTLAAAVESAARYSVSAAIWEPNGLAAFRRLVDDADWWRKYLEACEVVSR